MNEKIEDVHGLMSVDDFKRMFYTAFRQSSKQDKDGVYKLLLPIIINRDDSKSSDLPTSEELASATNEGSSYKVSIGQLSSFIDFFNYQYVPISSIRHPNDTSKDLYLYMGKDNLLA